MADADDSGQVPEKPRRHLAGMLAWLAVSVLAIGGGLATPYVVDQLQGASTDAEADPGTDPGPSDMPPPIPNPSGEVAYISFGEMTVNLDEGRMNRYLRLSIALQVDRNQQEALSEIIESNQIVLKNWLIGYLSDRDMEEIRGAAGQNRLRREIHDYFNATLFPDGYDRIQDVLFEEFNVQ